VKLNSSSKNYQIINHQATTGRDLITNQIIKHLPKKTFLLLTFIFNSILRLSYIPQSRKHSVVILIPKPDKPPDLSLSCRPISLLSSFSKILEKIILTSQRIILNIQFGFKNKHSSLHQVHRIIDIILQTFEKKKTILYRCFFRRSLGILSRLT
jgi:hypothetical protein